MSKNALLLTAPEEDFDITVIQYPCMPTTVNLCSVGNKGGVGDTISSHTSSFNLPEGADSYFLSITAQYLEDWTCKGLYYDGEFILSTQVLTELPKYTKVYLEKKVNRGERHTVITDNGSPANKYKFYIEAPGAESISATEIPYYANRRQTVMDYMFSIAGTHPEYLTIDYKFPNIVYPGNTVYSATEWLDLDTNRPIDNCYPTRDYRLRAITKESDDALVGSSCDISAEIDFSSPKKVKNWLFYEGVFKYSDIRFANRGVYYLHDRSGKHNPAFEHSGDYASFVFELLPYEGCLYLQKIMLTNMAQHRFSDSPNGYLEEEGMAFTFKNKRQIRRTLNCPHPSFSANGKEKTYEFEGSSRSLDNVLEFLLARENKDYPPEAYESIGRSIFGECFTRCRLGETVYFAHPEDPNAGSTLDSPYYITKEEQAQLEAEGKDPEAVLMDRIKKAVDDKSIYEHFPVTSFQNFLTITIS